MAKIDYGWIIAIAVVLVVIVLWKPITGVVGRTMGKGADAQAIERGKAVFYDVERWDGPGSYKSCAMCHAADFVPDPGKQITMSDYVAGKPYSLKHVGRKYHATMMDTGDELYEQVVNCLNDPARVNSGRVSSNAQFMKDLLAYVNSL